MAGVEDEKMKRKRRNHSASFKSKVALAAIRGDQTLVELLERFDVHQNQIQDWRRRLLNQADQVFAGVGRVHGPIRTWRSRSCMPRLGN